MLSHAVNFSENNFKIPIHPVLSSRHANWVHNRITTFTEIRDGDIRKVYHRMCSSMCLFRRINPLPSWGVFLGFFQGALSGGLCPRSGIGLLPPAHPDDDVPTGHNRHITPDLRPSYWAKQTKNNNQLILQNFPGNIENTDSGSFCKMLKQSFIYGSF